MTVRTLIVDDSPTMRSLIGAMLRRDPEIEVIGEAEGVETARKLMRDLSPDVVTLDVEMPGMNGLDFLEKIMKLKPTPVVMVSTLTTKGAEATIRALELGAVDCFAKPTGRIDDILCIDDGSLASMVRQAARTRVQPRIKSLDPVRPTTAAFRGNGNMIAIGASTGGVEALLDLLGRFPENCPPTVVVQHMPGNFTQQFADRLDKQCPPKVCVATTDTFMERGHVYIAPGGSNHLMVRGSDRPHLSLREANPVSGHRPSVDVMFRSVAQAVGKSAVGILLTGMGQDGARGLLEMRQLGCETIAQDETTSVVFGMPKAAVELNAASHVLPLGRIAQKALDLCSA